MHLNGVQFAGRNLKVSRPADYAQLSALQGDNNVCVCVCVSALQGDVFVRVCIYMSM